MVKICWFQLFSSSACSKCLDPPNETEYIGTYLGLPLAGWKVHPTRATALYLHGTDRSGASVQLFVAGSGGWAWG